MTQQYIIREMQNAQSRREGYTVPASSLSQAKSIASREQFFQGTVLVIEDDCGNRLTVKESGQWRDIPQ